MAYRIKLEGFDIECDTLDEMLAAKTLLACGQSPSIHRDIKPANAASDMILATVARCSGVSVAKMAGRSRVAGVVLPRHVACYLLRDNGLTYSEIGRMFSRDHSTVISACDSIELKIAREPEGIAARLISRILDAMASELRGNSDAAAGLPGG